MELKEAGLDLGTSRSIIMVQVTDIEAEVTERNIEILIDTKMIRQNLVTDEQKSEAGSSQQYYSNFGLDTCVS